MLFELVGSKKSKIVEKQSKGSSQPRGSWAGASALPGAIAMELSKDLSSLYRVKIVVVSLGTRLFLLCAPLPCSVADRTTLHPRHHKVMLPSVGPTSMISSPIRYKHARSWSRSLCKGCDTSNPSADHNAAPRSQCTPLPHR